MWSSLKEVKTLILSDSFTPSFAHDDSSTFFAFNFSNILALLHIYSCSKKFWNLHFDDFWSANSLLCIHTKLKTCHQGLTLICCWHSLTIFFKDIIIFFLMNPEMSLCQIFWGLAILNFVVNKCNVLLITIMPCNLLWFIKAMF